MCFFVLSLFSLSLFIVLWLLVCIISLLRRVCPSVPSSRFLSAIFSFTCVVLFSDVSVLALLFLFAHFLILFCYLVLYLFLFSFYLYLFCPVTVNFNLLSSASHHVPLHPFVVPVSPVSTWREDLGVGAAVAVATSLLYLALFFV
jgi:hypothetical protein